MGKIGRVTETEYKHHKLVIMTSETEIMMVFLRNRGLITNGNEPNLSLL